MHIFFKKYHRIGKTISIWFLSAILGISLAGLALMPEVARADCSSYIVMDAPSDGSTVSGTINVSAHVCSDGNDSVNTSAGIQFLIDGNSIGNAQVTAPYTTSLDTTQYPNGAHTIGAEGVDANGQEVFQSVNVTINNSGSGSSGTGSSPGGSGSGNCNGNHITVTSPANGATVSGTIVFTAQTCSDASDTVSNTGIIFIVDNNANAPSTLSTSPYTTPIDTTKLQNGVHSVVAATTDNEGPVDSNPVTFTVNNPNSTFGSGGSGTSGNNPSSNPFGSGGSYYSGSSSNGSQSGSGQSGSGQNGSSQSGSTSSSIPGSGISNSTVPGGSTTSTSSFGSTGCTKDSTSNRICNPLPENDLMTLVLTLLKYFMGIIGIIAVVVIVIAGFQLVVSQGDPTAVKSARSSITNAIIGLVVAMLAYSIVAIIEGILKH